MLMQRTTMTRKLSGWLAIAAALVLLCTSVFARADTSEIAALEARVAELETLVTQLMNQKSARTPDATANPAPQPIAASSSYKFGGYVKLDAMFSDYGDGDLAPGSAGTQFYIPSTIPVGGSSSGTNNDMQARETRINFRSDHVLPGGDKIGTFLEMDFFLGSAGDERISNSYNPRLRHAFIKYNNWLAGQTWSTFQDVGALAENLDFIGPSEGTTFVRQAMLRYTKNRWEFAIENPETTITPYTGGGRIVTDDNTVPDFVARYTLPLDRGYIKAAGLVRQLDIDNGTFDDNETAYGLSLSGKHMFGDDDIRWMATVGNGTGRYLGLNTANDAVLDGGGNLKAIEQWGGFVSYRHFWEPEWRSNLTFSYLNNDNDTALTGTGVTEDVYSVHANLLYEPVEKMTVGGEIMYAERTLETGESGDMTRVILSAKYAF